MGTPVFLDRTVSVGTGAQLQENPGFQAVLIQKDSGNGAVYVTGPDVSGREPRVRTKPEQPHEIVVLLIGPGQTCTVLGTPTFRWFRRRADMRPWDTS